MSIGDLSTIWLLIAAIILDVALGDPAWLFGYIAHPVVYIGRIISFFDKTFNNWELGKTSLIMRGYLILVILFVLGIVIGVLIELLVNLSVFLLPLKIFTIAIFLAIRSLYSHVKDVYFALNEGLVEAKAAVAKIVGRDVTNMTEISITRAAIESLAENMSDGVVAPIFWYLVGGLPGLIAYKCINTADSMIGHKSFKYVHFGRAVALCDDILNYIPARITAGLFLIMGFLGGGTAKLKSMWKTLRQDAMQHASPNAGWPETAMASMMDIALGGPRIYGDETLDGVWLNEAGRDILHRADIKQALKLYVMALFLMVVILIPLLIFYSLIFIS